MSPSSYTHISVRDLYISRMVCFSAAGSWNIHINRSQTHKCANWDWGRAIPRKRIYKWDFPYSVLILAWSSVSNIKIHILRSKCLHKRFHFFYSWENKYWKFICLMEIWITWSQTELAQSQFPIFPLEKEIINSRGHLEYPVPYFGWQIVIAKWPILATHIWAAVPEKSTGTACPLKLPSQHISGPCPSLPAQLGKTPISTGTLTFWLCG
jgi:hypothetical protein